LKKALGTFFLLLFLYQCIGYVPVYKFWEYKVKKEVKRIIRAGMANEELELVVMPLSWIETPPEHIEWEHSKEFVKDGVYYDIVRQEHKGDDVYLYCYRDTKETALSIGLDKHTNSYLLANEQKKETNRDIHQFFTKLYFSGSSEITAPLPLMDTQFEPFQFVDMLIYGELLSPPPQEYS